MMSKDDAGTPLTRRAMMARAMAGALIPGTVITSEVRAATSATHYQRSRLAGLKLSLNAYSFHVRLGQKPKEKPQTMNLYDVLKFCVKHEVPGLDPTAYFFPGYPNVPTDADLNAFKRAAHGAGVTLTGTGIRNDFVTPDKSVRELGVRTAKNWIEAAARLGSPVLRVFSGAALPPEQTSDGSKRLIDCLHQTAAYGEKYGVIVGVQNHGDFLQTAARCIEIVKAVNSPWLGLVVDTGNFKVADPYSEVAKVVQYAVNWQIKESPFGIASKVRTDMARMLDIIYRGGYRGFVPIETIETADPNYVLEVELERMIADFNSAVRDV